MHLVKTYEVITSLWYLQSTKKFWHHQTAYHMRGSNMLSSSLYSNVFICYKGLYIFKVFTHFMGSFSTWPLRNLESLVPSEDNGHYTSSVH